MRLNVGGVRQERIGFLEKPRTKIKWKNPSGTPTYFAWRSMRNRCMNPNNAAWKNYGGRGISVCERWNESYDAFVEDMGLRPEGLTLDRIDYDDNYRKENCRWVDWETQSNNRRNNVRIYHQGENLTIPQWGKKLGIDPSTIWRRFRVYGMSTEKVLSTKSLRKGWSHGTRHGYVKGCRCDECRSAHAKLHREMRAKRKHKAIAGECRKYEERE
jgi:hypothetical protein